MKRTPNHPSTPTVARRAKEGRSGAAAGLARRSSQNQRGLGLRSAKREGGFTLVELLVVIAIIGILAGITYPAVESILERAKKHSTLALIDAIDSGLEMFKTDFGHVPYDNSDVTAPGQEIPDSVEDRQEYARLWLLGLDYEGEPDGTHGDKSSKEVRDNKLWNGAYVEIRIEKHLDEGNEDCPYCFVDGWGNPLYFEFYDPEPKNSTTNKPIFNINKWDIWSKGSDEEGTEDMSTIGSSGDSYKDRRDKWKKVKKDGKEINRDNVINK